MWESKTVLFIIITKLINYRQFMLNPIMDGVRISRGEVRYRTLGYEASNTFKILFDKNIYYFKIFII